MMSDQPMAVVVTFDAEDLEWSAVDLSDWDAEFEAGVEMARRSLAEMAREKPATAGQT